MSAFFIATSTILDPEKFQEYGHKAGATVSKFGGEAVLKGKADQKLGEGQPDHQFVGIIKFDTIQMLLNWYQSEDYQALIPLREQAADMSIVSYAEPA